MDSKKDESEKAESDEVVIKRDPEIEKRRTAEIATRPVLAGGFTLEEIVFLVVFCLMFIGAMFVPSPFLDEHQIEILLLIVLPYLAWFVRLIYKDVKQHGK